MYLTEIKATLGRVVAFAARDQILRSMTWLGAGEFIARATRVLTTIILAWLLTPLEFGYAALALTSFEIVRAFATSGIGQMVVRVPDNELAGTAAAAQRATWLVCGLLTAVQLLAGGVLAFWTNRSDMLPMVGCLAGVFLLMPFGVIHSWLVIRAGRMDTYARVATLQLVVDNAMTAALALAGFGAWAIVLPKLLTAPLWVIGMRRAAVWPLGQVAQPVPAARLWQFAAPVLGSELMTAARLHLDKMLVSSVLGIEALGIYYFAVNAGLGLSLSLTTALSSSVYPVFAALAHAPRDLLARFDRALWCNALPIGGLIAAQALGALVYVPLIFGTQWAHAAPLVAMLCASALTKPASDCAAQLLRAAGMPEREFAGATAFTISYMTTFALFLGSGLTSAIAAASIVAFTGQVALTLRAHRLVRSLSESERPHGSTEASMAVQR